MEDDGPRSAPKSLHETIRHDLERRILSGDWPPGYKIPSELDLSEIYGCSRMTVNKVMTQLAAAGLILRRRRVGSVLLPQKSLNAVLEIHDVKEEVLSRGGWYRHQILSRRYGSAGRIWPGEALSEDAPALHVTCLHFSDNMPFCLEARMIFLDAVPEAKAETFTDTAPGVWLLEHVPWSEAVNEIAAVNADAALADLLKITPGAACLTMTRRTWKNGEAVTMASFSYPGAQHKMQARFTPAHG